MDDMNSELSRREPLNVTTEPGCDLLETRIFDVAKSVRAKNRRNAGRLETAGQRSSVFSSCSVLSFTTPLISFEDAS
jgi:hypothetical protein